MGLSVGIAGGIIMLTFLITFMMAPNTLVGLTSSLSGTVSDISDVEDRILKTSLNITSITAVQNQPDVAFTVTNNGLEKLWDYEKFDLLITYDQKNPPALVTEKMIFDGLCGAPAANPKKGEWCIDQFVDDILEPEILNTGESVMIEAQVQKNIASAADAVVIVIFTTDNGVTATKAILNP